MNTNNERPSCSGALSAVRLSSNGKQVKATEVRFRNDVALRCVALQQLFNGSS